MRRALATLVDPGEARVKQVDGLRAIAILWVFILHCIWCVGMFIPRDALMAVVNEHATHPLFTFFIRGDLGVDLFFVISGFLISGMLVRELETRGGINLLQFYSRRLLRLMPAYVVVLLLFCLLSGENWRFAWANLLYVNNFIPTAQQCMKWAWSLAIEEQFYLLFPWLLLMCGTSARRNLAVMVTLAGLGVALRAWLVWSHGVELPIVIHERIDPQPFESYNDVFYVKPYTRFGALLIGVAVTELMRSPYRRWVVDTPWSAVLLLWVGIMSWGWVIAPPIFKPGTEWSTTFSLMYLSAYHTVFAIGTAAFLLASFAARGVGAWWGRLLAAKAWHPIARLSYSTYLIHPIIIFGFYTLIGLKEVPSMAQLLGAMALCWTLTMALSLLLYTYVELPFMRMRPALSHVRLSRE
ncbi:acyltransferase [Myxococcus sp. AM009]|uniref:acyltransferase family protein n=1 Tax=Myxococcus sp. AM009 TaxID=2745137 RepID=UPI001595B22A|nr:acyltransferase [Myxococcus sp. AM009]NVI97753.1 acyltransferase [Myxococcus sp. AM009]